MRPLEVRTPRGRVRRRSRTSGTPADSVAVYLNEMGAVPLLTREGELELARRLAIARERFRLACLQSPVAREVLLETAGKLSRREIPAGAVFRRATLPPGSRIADVIALVRDLARRAGARRRSFPRLGDLEPPVFEAIAARIGSIAVANARREYHAARAEFVEANLRLVVSVARKCARRGVALEDLIQDGNLGLMRAVERFDPCRGLKFSTFATWWIWQSITRSLADRGRTIRLPVHMVERVNKIARARRVLLTQLGRLPSDQEIARRTGLDRREVTMVAELPMETQSLFDPVGDEDDAVVLDFTPDPHTGDPVEDRHAEQVAWAIDEHLSRLTHREATVLRMRFGIGGEPQTLEQVGHRYDLTRERIRQIELNAIRKLRRAGEHEPWPPLRECL